MTKQTQTQQKIVIVGGGFGGVRAALNLTGDDRFDVTLVSNRPHFEYHPGLYRTATGRSPLENVTPLENIFADSPNIKVALETIVKIDVKNHSVVAESGNVFAYDKLILATGNVTNYFGIEGLAEHACSMKNTSDALELREKLHQIVVNAHYGQPARFIVVGAGATGVELSSELCFYLDQLCRQHDVDTSSIKIDLIETANRILPLMNERLSARVARRLRRLGVNIRTKSMVEGERADSLKVSGKTAQVDVVVWTAGVANNPLLLKHRSIFTFDGRQRVKVDKYLSAAPNIYVIGDNASTRFTGLAQTALHDASFVTGNLQRSASGKSLRYYKSKHPIHVIPVGSHWAAVQWRTISLFGYLGWILRRLADLRVLLGFMPPVAAIRKWRRGGAPIKNPCPVCTIGERSVAVD